MATPTPRSRCCCCTACTDTRPTCLTVRVRDVVSAGVRFGLNNDIDIGYVVADFTAGFDETLTIPFPPGWSNTRDPCNSPTDENDTIAITGSPGAGSTFTVQVRGVGDSTPSDPIPYDASTSDLQSALATYLADYIGDSTITVTGSAGAWTVAFSGDLANTDIALSVNGSGLTDGATVAITRNTAGGGGSNCFVVATKQVGSGYIVFHAAAGAVDLFGNPITTQAVPATLEVWVGFFPGGKIRVKAEVYNSVLLFGGAANEQPLKFFMPIFSGEYDIADGHCFSTDPVLFDTNLLATGGTTYCGNRVSGFDPGANPYPTFAPPVFQTTPLVACATGGSATLTFGYTDDDCAVKPCACMDAPVYDDITPPITFTDPTTAVPGGIIVWFNNGDPIPAGTYCNSYVSGALCYHNVYDGGTQYRVNRFSALGRFCNKLVYNDGANTIVGPGLNGGFATQEAVEAANQGQAVTFVHCGGRIGMYLDDTFEGVAPFYHYGDNVTAPGGSAPTFRLCKIDDETQVYPGLCPSSQLTACPPDLSGCCAHYAPTIAGSATLDATYDLIFDGTQWTDGTNTLICEVEGGLAVWRIDLFGEFPHTLVFTAPVMSGALCPPTDPSAWTLVTNADGGTPAITGIASSGC